MLHAYGRDVVSFPFHGLRIYEFYMPCALLRGHQPLLGRATNRATQKAVSRAKVVLQHHSNAEQPLLGLEPNALHLDNHNCALVHCCMVLIGSFLDF